MNLEKIMRNRKLSSPELTKLRFFAKIKKEKDCWEWLGSKLPNGYGVFRANHTGKKTMWKAHRYSWLIHNGIIPENMCVLHKCDNPSCVNPEHLFLGTQLDNVLDMKNKGRLVAPSGEKHWTRIHPKNVIKGEQCAMAKLSNNQATEIREKYQRQNITLKQLSCEFNVCIGTIYNIVHYRTFKDL